MEVGLRDGQVVMVELSVERPRLRSLGGDAVEDALEGLGPNRPDELWGGDEFLASDVDGLAHTLLVGR
eukprot:5019887-Prymnesium_polylepis.1